MTNATVEWSSTSGEGLGGGFAEQAMAELDGALAGWVGVRHRENYILTEKIACGRHTRGKGLDRPAASTGKSQTHATVQPLGHESLARMFQTHEARGGPAVAGSSSVIRVILHLQPTVAMRHPEAPSPAGSLGRDCHPPGTQPSLPVDWTPLCRLGARKGP